MSRIVIDTDSEDYDKRMEAATGRRIQHRQPRTRLGALSATVPLHTVTRKEVTMTVTGTVTLTANVSFSDREVSVIQLLAQGLTFVEIGDRLEISPRTAQSYAESARKKLGIRHVKKLPAAFQEATGVNPMQ
jgi:DNA-binding CsgD family transcriptional regulator